MALKYTKIITIMSVFTIGLIFLTACSSNNNSSSQSQNSNDNPNNGTMVIKSINPSSGTAGQSVVITGSGFGSLQGSVKFVDIPASINSWSDTSISVVVPDMAAGGLKVDVVSGTQTVGIDFTVLPFISGISTNDVILNDTLIITGTSFGSSQGNSTINYAGTVLPVAAWTNNQITASIGNITHAASGLVNIIVNNSVSNGITLTVHPSISSLLPDTAEIGDEVSITGKLFGPNQGTSNVSFSGIPATVINWSDNLIRTKVPHSSVKGDVVVTVNNIPSMAMGFTVTKTFYTIAQPTGLVMDENGNMYVANYIDGTIIKVLPGGMTQTTIYKGLNHPMGLYYQPPSMLFVACEGDGTVQMLTLGDSITGYTYASGFSQPAGIAMDDTGNMYVTNYGSNIISMIDLDGKIRTFTSGLNKPMGIVFTGPAGGKTFIVANNGNGTIAVVNLFGAVINSAFVSGLDSPRYIMSDKNYNAYVTTSHSVIKVIPSGESIVYATGLSNPYGIIMDLLGYLYVSDSGTNTIFRIDDDYIVYAEGFSNPWGIAFNSSGTMFVANQGSTTAGSISVVTQQGQVQKFIGPEDFKCLNGVGNPIGITKGFNGDLVSTFSFALFQYSWILEAPYNGIPFVLGKCGDLNNRILWGIAFSTEKSLAYVTDKLKGEIITITALGESRKFASGFDQPEGIGLDSIGNVYVANNRNNTISMVTAAGKVTTTYAVGFSMPADLKFGSKGELLVSNYGNNSISMVTSNHNLYTLAEGISRPTGIAIDNNGIIYVASESEGKVYSLIHRLSRYIIGLNDVKGLAMGTDGRVYVADSANNMIYRIDTLDSLTTVSDQNAAAAWFTFDNAGNIVLTNFLEGTLMRISGHSLTTFATGFSGPTGIAYDTKNNIYYVLNYLNNTISIVTSAGIVSTFAVGLSGPMGVALLSPGNLYVAHSSNGTIAKVVQGSGVSTYASGFGLPIGVAIDAAKNLYVADQSANMIFAVNDKGGVSPYAMVTAPFGITFDGNDNLFVSDTMHKRIKEIILH